MQSDDKDNNLASFFKVIDSIENDITEMLEDENNELGGYECLVISNNARSNKLEDQIFWYKAEPHSEFKLGSKEFWALSQDITSDDEDEAYDPTAVKKGPKINVKKSKW